MQIRFVVAAVCAMVMAVEAHDIASSQGTPPVTVLRSAQHILDSEAVSDTFVIQIRLPPSYASSKKKYPVLYVLDGNKCFGLAADTADWLAWSEEAPEIIVVGIAYVEERDWRQKRSRDFTPTKDTNNPWGEFPTAGGASNFQDFFARELFPFVESRYRVLADDRAVAGVSFGGLFGAFSLFTRPTLFQRYILVAPAFVWDNNRLWQYEADYQKTSKTLRATVFNAVGDEDESAILTPWDEFNRLVKGRQYLGLRWLTQKYPGEGHISVLPGALSRGIRRIYED